MDPLEEAQANLCVEVHLELEGLHLALVFLFVVPYLQANKANQETSNKDNLETLNKEVFTNNKDSLANQDLEVLTKDMHSALSVAAEAFPPAVCLSQLSKTNNSTPHKAMDKPITTLSEKQ